MTSPTGKKEDTLTVFLTLELQSQGLAVENQARLRGKGGAKLTS